jgi:8-oxo-dGTP diphosphatase
MNFVRVGVGVFVVKNNKFLIGKRLNAHGAGTWHLPGGHLELGESFEECAKREVLEETGLKIANVSFLTVTNDVFEKGNKHYVTIFLKADYVEGEPKVLEPDKCEEWKWISWDELKEPLFLPEQNLLKSGFRLF